MKKMKNLFPGYCKKTESEIKKIWENGLIIFDTNVLLNLYRYSDFTRNTMLELISKFSKQIWLPNQAALEYNKNRYEVIAEQEKAYKEFLEKISQIQKDLQSTNKPPFLSADVDENLNTVFDNVSAEVHDSITKYCDYLKDDPIYNKLSDLFSNRITVEYTKERLQEIYTEGENRYKLKVPPGFEDEKTKEGIRKYGDLVLWKQIIDKAKEEKKDIILITDERKIDWWWKIKDGRNMGPRQELVEEMKTEANVDFHMYSSERFLSYGQSFLNEKVNQKALEEIQAMKKAEIKELLELKEFQDIHFKTEIEFVEKSNYINNNLNIIKERIRSIENEQEKLFKDSVSDSEVQEYIHNLSIQKAELEDEQRELNNKMRSYKWLDLINRNTNRSNGYSRANIEQYLKDKHSDGK